MNNLLDTPVVAEYEQWSVFDDRLPEKLRRIPPDEQFIEWIDKVQLQPIGVVYDGASSQWCLAFGRKRLLALRILAERNNEDRIVDVKIFHGLSEQHSDLFSLLENNQRSSNEIQDYQVLKQYLFTSPNPKYSEIASELGMATSTVKALEKKWHAVPDWAIEACLEGDIALSVALAIGKQVKTTQTKLKKKLKENGKLTKPEVDAEKKFVQKKQLATMAPSLGLTGGNGRDFFSRAELEEVLTVLKNETKAKGIEYIEMLLAEAS